MAHLHNKFYQPPGRPCARHEGWGTEMSWRLQHHSTESARSEQSTWYNRSTENAWIGLRKAKEIPERIRYLTCSLKKKGHFATWSEQKWNFTSRNNSITGSSAHVRAHVTGFLSAKLSQRPGTRDKTANRGKKQITINHLYQPNKFELCFLRDQSSLKAF